MRIERSELARVMKRILNEQDCDRCPLREACDIYEKESVTGCNSICDLLDEES